MKIAVVGSSGGMGSFFVRYFLGRGFDVSGSDVRRARRTPPRFRYRGTNREAAEGRDFVVLAVPVERTVDVASELVGSMKKGSTLVEISSVKGEVLPALRALAGGAGVSLLPIHPLFGPTQSRRSGGGMRIAVVTPDGGGGMRAARLLFPDARLLEVSEAEHDRMMALTLSLTHAVNLLYAKTVARHTAPERFRMFRTPNSAVQLTLAEAVLSQSPSLYSYIQVENRHTSEVLQTLSEELAALKSVVDGGDRRGFEESFAELQTAYGPDLSRRSALDDVYRAAARLRDA